MKRGHSLSIVSTGAARARRRQRGFSLLETLVAISVLSICLLGFSTGTTAILRANQQNNNLTAAAMLAQDKLEELKVVPTLPASGTETGLDADGAAGGIFDRAWTITPNYAAVANLTQIGVTLTWTDHTAHTLLVATVRRD